MPEWRAGVRKRRRWKRGFAGQGKRIGRELTPEHEWETELEAGAEFGLAAAQMGRKRGSGICDWR